MSTARAQIHVATALLHLADFYFFFGRFSTEHNWLQMDPNKQIRFNDAEPVLQRALDIRQRNLNGNPLDYALCLEKVLAKSLCNRDLK